MAKGLEWGQTPLSTTFRCRPTPSTVAVSGSALDLAGEVRAAQRPSLVRAVANRLKIILCHGRPE